MFSQPVMSYSLWPHGLQNIRPSIHPSFPEVCPSLCSFHQWCHPTVSSSDALFYFCPKFFPASGSFPMSQVFASVQFSSVTQSCPTLWDPMNRSTPDPPVDHQLPESTQTHGHWVGDAIQPSHPLSSPSTPALNLSQDQGLFRVSSSHQVARYWSFSFNMSPSNEHPGLISFRMDWLDLLIVQGTLKSLLQYHSSKASILWHSAFFTVQLLHPYMTPGKTIALTRRTFVDKVMSLLFNMLSRLGTRCHDLSFLNVEL